jgi:DNA-binding CsgD family transcriptional regulator
MQVVRLLCEGLTNEEIAKKMNVSMWTIRSGHLHNIFQKTGQTNRVGVAMCAVKNGLIAIKGSDRTNQRINMLEDRLQLIEQSVASTRKLLEQLKESQL